MNALKCVADYCQERLEEECDGDEFDRGYDTALQAVIEFTEDHSNLLNDLDLYQKEAARTMRDGGNRNIDLLLLALGAVGEAGEVADLVKKMVRDGGETEALKEKLAEELGDVAWYIAALCEAFGLTLSGVALRNVAKLQKRYESGFTPDGGKR